MSKKKEMEKSSCVQLTPEQHKALKSYFDRTQDEQMVKQACDTALQTGLSMEELKGVLNSGEYRIVED